jgi:hypothetical protein
VEHIQNLVFAPQTLKVQLKSLDGVMRVSNAGCTRSHFYKQQ